MKTQEWKTFQAIFKKNPIISLISLFYVEQIPYFIAPDPRSLPSIPENVSMGERGTGKFQREGTYVQYESLLCVLIRGTWRSWLWQ